MCEEGGLDWRKVSESHYYTNPSSLPSPFSFWFLISNNLFLHLFSSLLFSLTPNLTRYTLSASDCRWSSNPISTLFKGNDAYYSNAFSLFLWNSTLVFHSKRIFFFNILFRSRVRVSHFCTQPCWWWSKFLSIRARFLIKLI